MMPAPIESAFNPRVPEIGTAPLCPPASVLQLTPDQAQTPLIEIRDPEGKILGFLLKDPQGTFFFGPEEFADIQRRASNPKPGKLLSEILKETRAKVGA